MTLIHLTGFGATAHLESGGFIRSRPGVTHPDIQFHFLPSQVIDHGRIMPKLEAYQVSFKDCTLALVKNVYFPSFISTFLYTNESNTYINVLILLTHRH